MRLREPVRRAPIRMRGRLAGRGSRMGGPAARGTREGADEKAVFAPRLVASAGSRPVPGRRRERA
jgi:hypothetical protein